MSGVNDIRAGFIDYFARNGHEAVASSPLVPRNDPTLMFTNAGMVQFKNVFTGLEKRPYQRAVTAQKCVRAGGKHNDLDNVGYTARHHTFFEMLGNFSFGDYFKDRAIELAWNLITKDFGLPKDRLMATVYIDDDQAFDLWKKIAGLPDSRIIRIAGSDNFWAMGDTGPCGPCSEIFYDHGDHIPGGPPGSPDADGDRFIEIWNLVFMQYEQLAGDKRVDLPKPSIDTGMGLERIAAVMQGTHDNYATDMMRSLIRAVADNTGIDADGPQKVSHRVIADHLRATSFLIADGVLPSNEGRGYVLRRIMRRAMRHAELLGAKEPLMWKLVPALSREMGQAYPELLRAEPLITETLKLEETRFRKTLERGLSILDDETKSLKKGDKLKGETAFTLYDTYGFPLDLTQDALRPRGIGVDTDAFNAAMDKQREKARASWSGSGDAATEAVWFGLREKAGATEFLGYETETAEGVVTALVRDGKGIDALKKGESGAVILNQTPFYGESGGQVGDTGRDDGRGRALPCHRHAEESGRPVRAYRHSGRGHAESRHGFAARCGSCAPLGDPPNHSATHLLHEALRQVLGDHVAQKGSLVAPDRLRFDFSHPKPMTAEEIEKVEDIANDFVLQNSSVTTRLMGLDDARASGARALFGEKYGDEVRVVAMGEGARQHARLVGRIVRRHACQTHRRYRAHLRHHRCRRRRRRAPARSADRQGRAQARGRHVQVARMRPRATPARHAWRTCRRACRNCWMSARGSNANSPMRRRNSPWAAARPSPADDGVRAVGDVKLLARAVEGIDLKDLRSLADEGKKQIGSGIVAIVGKTEDGKAGIVVGVTADLTKRFSAVDLVRAGAEALGGKGGGGRPDMAQAGGPDGGKADAALAAIEAALGGR